ncbi:MULTISPECIES: acetyl-CoA carboxylase biotin carboxylase subunit [Agrobacterium]|uniref:Biotin carboxylase n=1 Tax=Agrobacterium rubi TaxID=28099 RepID=A0AAE7RDI6_9HYPH|nr:MULTISPECIES: acetyl-CoA carboxylase biotin carboxylase subunit [Agrobacterium]MBN7808931.1 acetyl-CoA carboxylase biotin carboxylase subunit [Agrobacterium rosae]NTE89867.1 acetyl-CoA carboxylase biotin carboxylase subunit [Agrobacterium rubi]NTF05283.1 acetyl-CoA carboxylase biotin carboxylase subunit [Agrobacterium rubi]NTF10543.1 acetyl-CoA carboxylase biotin carboxylase subunit [Agrobacterium rubi]NTF22937.1 acetyl-CoA carboxylase biotin carboxylase subunit [Agrobacterium rubi]
MNFSKILVANRGEIAVRIIKAARELGLSTVQVVSKADHEMLSARMADERVEIGPAHASKSYLRTEAIIEAALQTGAEAIHPGYGFLSENADFAQAVKDAGLVFIGPTADTIRSMGDKAVAREMARRAGVPTVPGSDGRVDQSSAADVARLLGLPLMIKAAAGGGGRGIRVAETVDELEALMSLASTEALAAFGDGGIYLERFIARARHVEVQVLGDGVDAIHLFERECSIQRRRQKVWEEAPAPYLSDSVRARICKASVAIAKQVSYTGAGTVEFLYDDKTDEFFFIEMNTRIQVEHPVTEMVTGIDLVQEMIKIAGGERLSLRQNQIKLEGHSIECRITAEDPENDFRPTPGTITDLSVPEGKGVRFDSHIYAGYTIPPFYDSLLGKLIVWGADREAAIGAMQNALRELKIVGVVTTIPLHDRLASSDDVRSMNTHTRWLETWLQ